MIGRLSVAAVLFDAVSPEMVVAPPEADALATDDVHVSVPFVNASLGGICDSVHNLQCVGDDLEDFGVVTTHDECCTACQNLAGCNAWTWNWRYGGHCYLKSACSDPRQSSTDDYHSGIAQGPLPPPPPSPPSPSPSPSPGPTDLIVDWVSGRGHGACDGPAIQGDDVVSLHGTNGITLSTDASPAGGCVFRTAQPSIDLSEYPHIEVDLHTSGNRPAYGTHGGQWFSFWMYPPGYAYDSGISNSGEVDFVENINSVRTNFAGCTHDCHETSWGQASNAVSAHVTMHYDSDLQRVNVYRCAFGAATCMGGDVAYVDLEKMVVHTPYTYTLCTDVWYAQPGMDFRFSVSNLRILRE